MIWQRKSSKILGNTKRSWWHIVNEVCHEGEPGEAGSDDSDEARDESDLDSLCSDEEEDTVKKSKQRYNPRTRSEDFKFKFGMEFPSIDDLRHVLKEEFIRGDREFRFVK